MVSRRSELSIAIQSCLIVGFEHVRAFSATLRSIVVRMERRAIGTLGIVYVNLSSKPRSMTGSKTRYSNRIT